MRNTIAARAGSSAAKSVFRIIAYTTILGLAACGGAPYVDSRREAGQTNTVGASTPDRIAICYSSQSTTPQEILALAESECAKTGRTARFSDQDIAACNVSTPTRAFFSCVAKP